jgi:tungstate transport system substrate-binding protein
MKKLLLSLSVVLLCFTLPDRALAEDKILKMSTTTSTQSSGLLDFILPEFTKDTGVLVKVIAKGTGAAIRDGIDGNVDIIFVHAKDREEKFVSDGFGTKRYPVMHNDFIILGPAADPAGIKGCSTAAEALRKIATASAFFVSRGDDSGTHTKEQSLWKETGIPLEQGSQTLIEKGIKKLMNYEKPSGDWYLSIGQGMGKALTFADEKQAYILADRGTYIKYKFGRDLPIALDVLCEGGDALANPYGIIPVNPAKHPHVKNDLAEQFTKWITSARGQKLISDYHVLGKQLFYPDVIK